MRTISTYRRRSGLVDLCWPARQAIRSYILKAASNFDGGFAPFAVVPGGGWKSRSVVINGLDSGSFRGKTRIAFSLADFGMDDAKPLWFRIAPISLGGVVGADEPIHLILPYGSQPLRPVVIRGVVPAAASVSGSLELNLPGQCTNPTVQNDGASDLYVAFEPGGAEFRVPPLATDFTNLYSAASTFSQLFLRGSGGATTVNANLVLRNEATSC
jgi:hypothetical protein